jgi:protoheme IX farnesyltransferase
MILLAWRLFGERDAQRARQAAHRLFGFSILYLFVIFAALLIAAGFLRHAA